MKVLILYQIKLLLNFSAKTTDFSPWMKQESNLVDKIPWALARGSLFSSFGVSHLPRFSKLRLTRIFFGKLVQLSAEITNITDTGLSFSVASKQFSMAQISCRVTDKQQPLALKNGQTVTVKGVVGGQTIGVIDVSNCSVVQ